MEDLTVRKWYQSPSKFSWMALTILSGGLLGPTFIAFIRELKHRRLIAALNILGIFSAALGFAGVILWIVALVLCLVLKEKSVPSYKSNKGIQNGMSEENQQVDLNPLEVSKGQSSSLHAEPHSKDEDVADEDLNLDSDSLASPDPKMGFLEWLKFVASIKPEIRRHEASMRDAVKINQAMKSSLDEFANSIKNISGERFSTEIERNIFEVDGCRLIEVRKGARVTHRESTYSGSSMGGSIGVGRVRVGGGSSGGSSSSTSISYPAPDELTQIDRGKFIMTNLKLSFSGTMFTKTTEFKKVVDFSTNGRQLLIAPKTGSKIWISEFPSFAAAWIASAFLNVAFETPEKRLDAKGSLPFGGVFDGVKSAFRQVHTEISDAISRSDEELNSMREIWEGYKHKYPKYVKDVNF